MLKFFAEKKNVSSFCSAKATHIFQQKILEYCVLNLLKQLTEWPLTSSLTTLWTTGPILMLILSLSQTHTHTHTHTHMTFFLRLSFSEAAILSVFSWIPRPMSSPRPLLVGPVIGHVSHLSSLVPFSGLLNCHSKFKLEKDMILHRSYRESLLQHHLFLKIWSLKRICCCKECLISRMICK